MSQIFYQVLDFSIPDATAVDTVINAKLQLESEYSKCDGVAVYMKSDAGNSVFDLGISDTSGVTHHELVDSKHFIPGMDAPINNRFLLVDLPIVDGRKVQVNCKVSVLTTEITKFQVVFRLIKD